MDIRKYKSATVNIPLNFILSLVWCNQIIVLCSTEHGLLRAKDPYTFLINPSATEASNLSGNLFEVEQSTANPLDLSTYIAATDSSTSQDKAESSSFLESLNQTSSIGVLSLDYELESDTNKTKRSKSPIRWLKSTLGLGSSGSVGNQPKSELMEGQSDLPRESMGDSSESPPPMESGGDGSILSKLNPFTNIKRKLSSKVSTVSNTAGQVYQTIAGKVGLGSSSGSGNTETGASDADMGDNGSNSGMRDKEDDEESSAHHSRAPLALFWISTFSLIVSFSS